MRVKIVLVLVIVIIRILYSRNLNRFKKRLGGETTISINDVKRKVPLFQLVQIVLVAGIIILSVWQVQLIIMPGQMNTLRDSVI
jgi:hypothetical protein